MSQAAVFFFVVAGTHEELVLDKEPRDSRIGQRLLPVSVFAAVREIAGMHSEVPVGDLRQQNVGNVIDRVVGIFAGVSPEGNLHAVGRMCAAVTKNQE